MIEYILEILAPREFYRNSALNSGSIRGLGNEIGMGRDPNPTP